MAASEEMDMNYVSDVMKTMYNFSLNKQFTDFTIRAGETTVHVHQSVICAKSDFFRAICQSGNSEALMKNAKGEDGEILSAIQRFMYFGKTTITAQNVEALALSADFIKNQELKEKCETFMMNNLTLVKLQPYHSLAQRIELPRLQAECQRISKEQFSEVSQSNWYFGLSLEEIYTYLQDDELNAPQEYQVLQAVLRWLENSSATPAGKEGFVERLFPCLRLSFCNRSELDALCKDPNVPKSLKLGVLEYLNYGMHSDHQPRRFTERSAEGATTRAASIATTPKKPQAATSTPSAPPPAPPRATLGTSSATQPGKKTEEKVLIVGGIATGNMGKFDIFGLENDHSDPITQVPSPNPSLCPMDDALLLSGGNDHTNTSKSLVRKFVFASRSWISLPDTPKPVTFHGSACVNKQLYTMGGCYKEKGEVKKRYASMNVLDLTSRKWSKCKPMPLSVDYLGIAVVDAFIFAIGGNTGKKWSLQVHKYDTLNATKATWEPCQQMPASANIHTSTAVVNRNIYVISHDFFMYIVDADVWTKLSLPIHPSYGCSMVLHHRCLVVTGGFEKKVEEPNDRVQVYDIATRTWRIEKYTMPLALWFHRTVVARI